MSSSLSLFLSLSLYLFYLFYLILFYTRLPSRGETLVADFKLAIDSFSQKMKLMIMYVSSFLVTSTMSAAQNH